MKTRATISLVVCVLTATFNTAWALDEAILTPTNDIIRSSEETSFTSAMGVWNSHRYAEGEGLLAEFAKKYPNSRWRAEAELHRGCYLTYIGNSSDAKSIFEQLKSESTNSQIRAKAILRLANIDQREARTDDAIARYARVLRMDPTWDQFKYANYNARKLLMTRGREEARINCGPVALAACFDALGQDSAASSLRSIILTQHGTSLGELEAQCALHDIPARSVEMSLEDLPDAALPVLAYVEPKHFVAIMSVEDGIAEIEDSIRGKYQISLNALSKIWGGKVLTFAFSQEMKPLTLVASLETMGGCCGQIDEDECLGDPCDCSHTGSNPSSAEGCTDCGPGDLPSPGRPTWHVNVNNLNILVKDTPVFYNPGRGPMIVFTLTYSNENSNTGIFGRGWRCPYDMKVFFLPSTYQNYPSLQVHRDSGRIETYEWDGSKYNPRAAGANYGYRDTIEKQLDGTVILSLRSGGKYYFMPEGSVAEGRIRYIEDDLGNRVTCSYDISGNLESVIDANGGVTDIVTEGVGINERVTNIRIPRYVDGDWVRWVDDVPAERREAVLDYTQGNLTYIRDMMGDASTLSYDAMLFYTSQASSATSLDQDVTTTHPANGGSLLVHSTDGFFASGKLKINFDEEISYTGKTLVAFTGITRGATPKAVSRNEFVTQVVPSANLSVAITESTPANGGSLSVNSTASFPESGWIAINGTSGIETLRYTGKTATSFTGIIRGAPLYAASTGSSVYLCSQSPYLSEIVTPAKKSKFTYEWFSVTGSVPPVVGLHEVYECGPTESYSATPTIHYAWCANRFQTAETRYPDSVHSGATSNCDWSNDHWSGGLRRIYDFSAGNYDATNFIKDELDNILVAYVYNDTRNRIMVTDASQNTSWFYYTNDSNIYGTDGKHNMYLREDPLRNKWRYTYNDDHSLHTESDAYGRIVKTYSYNSAGQITQVETPLGVQVINNYDSQGRLTYSTDARGKTTHYYYNGDPRGFLTSVEDPEGKTTSYQYDARGRLGQVTDPGGIVTRFEYDDLDRATKTIYGSGQNDPYVETKYTCCNKAYQQDENGRRVYYVYDTKVRPYKSIHSAISTILATSITTSFPGNGGNLSVASVADFPDSGKVVVLDEILSYTGRDIQNNLFTGITRGVDGTRVVEADSDFPVGRVDSVPATYGYHPQYLDRMISLSDALNHTTYYEHYLNGKLKTIRYPDNTGERYTYDNNNSGNNMIVKEYGEFSGVYPNQTFTPNTDFTVNYQYDGNNRLLRSY